MIRSLLILIGGLALGAAIFAGSYLAARHATEACCAQSDELNWLRTEFHLTDAEMARIRGLHAAYRPQCAEICAKIAAKQRELQAVLGASTNVTAEAQAKLDELAALRAQCQAHMLRHFIAVSQAMPPEQGRRYLAEMQAFSLRAHESMAPFSSGETGHEHQH